jgi:plasmid stabilization system protein ParE
MKLPITFHRAASAEFIEASVWCENKKAGLGREFISEIEHRVLLASEYPCQFALIHRDIRRIVTNRFPYNVYFRVEDHRIVILAVFHSRRNPAIWKTRA